MDKTIAKKEFQSALEEYKQNIDFTLDTYSCDDNTTEIIHEVAKQTFYALDHFAEIVLKCLD